MTQKKVNAAITASELSHNRQLMNEESMQDARTICSRSKQHSNHSQTRTQNYTRILPCACRTPGLGGLAQGKKKSWQDAKIPDQGTHKNENTQVTPDKKQPAT